MAGTVEAPSKLNHCTGYVPSRVNEPISEQTQLQQSVDDERAVSVDEIYGPSEEEDSKHFFFTG